jgi:hypothetical protein
VAGPLTCLANENIEEFGPLHFSLEPDSATAPTRDLHLSARAAVGSRHMIRLVVLEAACLAGLGDIAAAAKKPAPPPASEVVMPVLAGNKADRRPLAIKLD